MYMAIYGNTRAEEEDSYDKLVYSSCEQSMWGSNKQTSFTDDQGWDYVY
jgi:hypothetical protein